MRHLFFVREHALRHVGVCRPCVICTGVDLLLVFACGFRPLGLVFVLLLLSSRHVTWDLGLRLLGTLVMTHEHSRQYGCCVIWGFCGLFLICTEIVCV